MHSITILKYTLTPWYPSFPNQYLVESDGHCRSRSGNDNFTGKARRGAHIQGHVLAIGVLPTHREDTLAQGQGTADGFQAEERRPNLPALRTRLPRAQDVGGQKPGWGSTPAVGKAGRILYAH